MVLITDSFLEFDELSEKQKVKASFEWLRENCRCSSCYNKVTNQRNIRIFDIDSNIHPVTYFTTGNKLIISWSDKHQSEYDTNWLLSQSRLEERPQENLWYGNVSKEVEYVSATEIKSQHGVTRLVKSLLQYGVGFVNKVCQSVFRCVMVLLHQENKLAYEQVDPTVAATEEVIRQVGAPLQTLFGGMWEFSDKMDHMDTAYTNQALDPHTDTCYFIEPAGLIIFHCIKRNCEGGETLLVDGFRAAKQVKLENPQHYECLKTVHTEYQYIEKDHHLAYMSPILNHWPDGNIKQIRYNLYDRSARSVQPPGAASLFYRSLRHLAAAVSDTGAQWRLTLAPGTVAFINNWRVLHGRTAYTGARTMTGAYLAMGSLLSKARLLKLLL